LFHLQSHRATQKQVKKGQKETSYIDTSDVLNETIKPVVFLQKKLSASLVCRVYHTGMKSCQHFRNSSNIMV